MFRVVVTVISAFIVSCEPDKLVTDLFPNKLNTLDSRVPFLVDVHNTHSLDSMLVWTKFLKAFAHPQKRLLAFLECLSGSNWFGIGDLHRFAISQPVSHPLASKFFRTGIERMYSEVLALKVTVTFQDLELSLALARGVLYVDEMFLTISDLLPNMHVQLYTAYLLRFESAVEELSSCFEGLFTPAYASLKIGQVPFSVTHFVKCATLVNSFKTSFNMEKGENVEEEDLIVKEMNDFPMRLFGHVRVICSVLGVYGCGTASDKRVLEWKYSELLNAARVREDLLIARLSFADDNIGGFLSKTLSRDFNANVIFDLKVAERKLYWRSDSQGLPPDWDNEAKDISLICVELMRLRRNRVSKGGKADYFFFHLHKVIGLVAKVEDDLSSEPTLLPKSLIETKSVSDIFTKRMVEYSISGIKEQGHAGDWIFLSRSIELSNDRFAAKLMKRLGLRLEIVMNASAELLKVLQSRQGVPDVVFNFVREMQELLQQTFVNWKTSMFAKYTQDGLIPIPREVAKGRIGLPAAARSLQSLISNLGIYASESILEWRTEVLGLHQFIIILAKQEELCDVPNIVRSSNASLANQDLIVFHFSTLPSFSYFLARQERLIKERSVAADECIQLTLARTRTGINDIQNSISRFKVSIAHILKASTPEINDLWKMYFLVGIETRIKLFSRELKRVDDADPDPVLIAQASAHLVMVDNMMIQTEDYVLFISDLKKRVASIVDPLRDYVVSRLIDGNVAGNSRLREMKNLLSPFFSSSDWSSLLQLFRSLEASIKSVTV